LKAFSQAIPKNRPLRLCLAALFFISSIGPSAGQCGNTFGSRTYDTLITGPGYGAYTLTFPKWNPDSGTLVSVKLSATVTQQYAFTLKNADLMPSVYTILVGRYDEFSGPAMGTTFSNTTERNIGIFALPPNTSVTRAPFAFLQNYTNSDSITAAVAPFAGTGNLSFVYAPITYTDVHANNNASYSYNASAGDSIHFSISYQFCGAALLASSLINFSAMPEDPSTVELSWTMANEEAGRSYEVQESQDGVHFSSVGALSSIGGGTGNVDYRYAWSPPGGQAGGIGNPANGKWYFRLKIDAADGRSGYSAIKMVTFGSGSGGLRLYPVPATDFVNLIFPDISGADTPLADAEDWQVDIFAADGRLAFRQLYPAARSARLNFGQTLSRGTYFLRATGRLTNKIFISSFVVK
jgi:hypothetical protein